MRSRHVRLLTTALALAFAAGSAQAVPFSSPDPRSFAMGGAGVAAGTSANAVFLNPSLLALKRDDDRFSIELPILGGRLLDQGSVIDEIDDFDSNNPVDGFDTAIDQFNSGNPDQARATLIQSADDLIAELDGLSGKVLQLEGSAAVVIGIPGERLGMSLFANAHVVGGMFATFSDEDRQAIIDVRDAAAGNAPIPSPVDTFTSSANASFAVLTEFGVSIARSFDELGGVSLGVTPKLVKVTTYDYLFVGNQLDDIEIDLDRDERSDSGINFDLGASRDFGNGLVAGLAIKNVIAREYETAAGNTFKLEPQARIGAAYRPPALGWITLAADLDLTENQPAGLDSKTQYAGLGVEFDAMRTLQLRLGYRHNLSDLPSDLDSGMFSAGVGFSPLGIHLDAAVAGNSDDLGVALQFGFRI